MYDACMCQSAPKVLIKLDDRYQENKQNHNFFADISWVWKNWHFAFHKPTSTWDAKQALDSPTLSDKNFQTPFFLQDTSYFARLLFGTTHNKQEIYPVRSNRFSEIQHSAPLHSRPFQVHS